MTTPQSDDGTSLACGLQPEQTSLLDAWTCDVDSDRRLPYQPHCARSATPGKAEDPRHARRRSARRRAAKSGKRRADRRRQSSVVWSIGPVRALHSLNLGVASTLNDSLTLGLSATYDGDGGQPYNELAATRADAWGVAMTINYNSGPWPCGAYYEVTRAVRNSSCRTQR